MTVFSASVAEPLGRDFMMPGRSPARSRNAMAATSHPLATATALDILRRGGNAVDAALAACAVLSFAEPHQSGPGGDCFALLSLGGGDRMVAYNGSGRAPAGIDAEAVAGRCPQGMEYFDPSSVTVPGAVEAWVTLSADHGRLPLADVLRPAISLAEDGVVVHDRVAFDWRVHAGRIRRNPHLARRFLRDGDPLPAGSVIRFPELAATLASVAAHGRAGFYEGPVAAAMVAALRAEGGAHTAADFASHRGEYVEPVSATYRGYEVHQCPPNSQGLVALTMLGILERLDLDPDGPQGYWRTHSLVEAARFAFALRERQLADPREREIDVQDWLAPGLLDRAAASIRHERHLPEFELVPLSEHRDTVYLTVVDAERNAVSLINSIFEPFGSTIVAPEAGVLFHNRGLGFSLDAGHPNALAAGRRPLHTIIPGMLTRDGVPVMPFGVMGGNYQPVGHAQILSGLLDYGLDLQTTIDLPRLFPFGGKVWVERGIDADLRRRLVESGHVLADRVEPVGGAQAIWIDPATGVLTGASDSRKDGCALGY